MSVELLVNIDVNDLDSAVDFYQRAFDLKVRRRFDFGAELCGTTAAIFLLVKSAGSAPAATTAQRRHYERHWTPVHLDFIVPDLDQAVIQAVKAGALLESPNQTHVWGRIAMLADPFGHGFCLIQLLGRGYDEIAIG